MKLVLQEILAQIVAFVILLWVLRKVAWKPLLSLLDERRNRIQEAFDKIESSRKEIDALKSDYEKKFAEIEHEARSKIQEAMAEGRGLASEIQEKARQEAREILERAKENIELEIGKARIELKDVIVSLTLQATENLLREKLDPSEHKRLISQFLEEVGKIKK